MMAGKRLLEVIVVNGRVIKYRRDRAGNDLTCVLRWCDTHQEPVWVHGDGSFSCPYDLVIEAHTDDHDLVDAPWEAT